MPEPTEQPRIYYGYTPHVEPDGRFYFNGVFAGVRESSARACVAVQVDPNNNTIKYGVSVCSENDNFCKAKGRQLALESLYEGFGEVPINTFYARMESDHKRALFFLNTKVNSIFKNVRAYQRKMEVIKKENANRRSARASV